MKAGKARQAKRFYEFGPFCIDLAKRRLLRDGEPVQLTAEMSLRPAIAPDGKLIAYFYMDQEVWGIAVIGFDGGPPIKRFPIPPTVKSREIRWTPDGQALAYIDSREGVANIWSQPLDGGKPAQLTGFESGQLIYFGWSHDGNQFAYARGSRTGDVVLISNFR